VATNRDIRYSKDIKGTGRLLRSKEMEAVLRHHAQKGKRYAEAIASGFIRTGDYESSFRVASSKQGAGRWADRAAAYLYNDSDHAVLVEYVDDHRVLGTVVDIIENGL
jgi:hypothetical protein